MTVSKFILLGAAALSMAAITLAAPALAQQPRRGGPALDAPTRITEIDETGRVRTRLTVKRRSFLDPGSEVSTSFQDHYQDYAVVPGGFGTGFHDKNNYDVNFNRAPLLAPFDARNYRDF